MLVRRRNELRDAAQMSFDCQVYVWVLLKDSNIIAVSGPGHDGNYIGEVTKPTITNRAHVFHLSFFYMCALGGALSVKSYREWNGGVWHLHSAGRRSPCTSLLGAILQARSQNRVPQAESRDESAQKMFAHGECAISGRRTSRSGAGRNRPAS